MGRRGPNPKSLSEMKLDGTLRDDKHAHRSELDPALVDPESGIGVPPPSHLSDESAAFWRHLIAELIFEPHHYLLLQKLCEAWDESNTARRVLDESGHTFLDRFGQPRPRPECKIFHDSSLRVARLSAQLNFDEGPPHGCRVVRSEYQR